MPALHESVLLVDVTSRQRHGPGRNVEKGEHFGPREGKEIEESLDYMRSGEHFGQGIKEQ